MESRLPVPRGRSAQQTLNKLVSREGTSVLTPEQQHMVNGDPASPASHQHSSGPGRAGGIWKEILDHHLQGRWDAPGVFITSICITVSEEH